MPRLVARHFALDRVRLAALPARRSASARSSRSAILRAGGADSTRAGQQIGELVPAPERLGQLRQLAHDERLGRRRRQRRLQVAPGALAVALARAPASPAAGAAPPAARSRCSRCSIGSSASSAVSRRARSSSTASSSSCSRSFRRRARARRAHALGVGADRERLLQDGARRRRAPPPIDSCSRARSMSSATLRAGSAVASAMPRKTRASCPRSRARVWIFSSAIHAGSDAGRGLDRAVEAVERAGRIVQAILEQLALLHVELGLLFGRLGEADLGVEQLLQVRPQRAPLEHAADGPQVGLERRVRLQRLGVGLDRRALVAGARLGQLADLVLIERGARPSPARRAPAPRARARRAPSGARAPFSPGAVCASASATSSAPRRARHRLGELLLEHRVVVDGLDVGVVHRLDLFVVRGRLRRGGGPSARAGSGAQLGDGGGHARQARRRDRSAAASAAPRAPASAPLRAA